MGIDDYMMNYAIGFGSFTPPTSADVFSCWPVAPLRMPVGRVEISLYFRDTVALLGLEDIIQVFMSDRPLIDRQVMKYAPLHSKGAIPRRQHSRLFVVWSMWLAI